jgi:hypothetical protein
MPEDVHMLNHETRKTNWLGPHAHTSEPGTGPGRNFKHICKKVSTLFKTTKYTSLRLKMDYICLCVIFIHTYT